MIVDGILLHEHWEWKWEIHGTHNWGAQISQRRVSGVLNSAAIQW